MHRAKSLLQSPYLEIGILVLLSVITIFFGLGQPSEVIFDEVHFGKFVNAYCCTHERIFDIHPPHSKLFVAAFVKLFSAYNGGLSFESIGLKYDVMSAIPFRLFPALMGTLIPLAAFFLLRSLHVSTAGAFLGAFALMLDNGLKIQSRVISLDGMLVFAMLCAMTLSLNIYREQSRKVKLSLALAAGIAGGFAVGTKITGLVGISIPLLILFFRTRILGKSEDGLKKHIDLLACMGIFVLGAVAVYLAGWYIHFAILDKPGNGDLFYKPVGNFFLDMINMQRQMVKANVNLDKGHPYGSPWWSWPFMVRGVYYWAKGTRYIYFLGNPVVWMGAFFTAITATAVALTELQEGKDKIVAALTNRLFLSGVLFFLVFANAFLPYMGVRRVLFLYHYLPPMVFSVILSAIWLEYFGWFKEGGVKNQDWRYYTMIAAIVVGFLLIAPLTYGWNTPEYSNIVFKLLPGWR